MKPPGLVVVRAWLVGALHKLRCLDLEVPTRLIGTKHAGFGIRDSYIAASYDLGVVVLAMLPRQFAWVLCWCEEQIVYCGKLAHVRSVVVVGAV